MAKKKPINKRCPLAQECGKSTCDYVGTEHKCTYYKYNARPGLTIPDQEAILELQRKQLEMELDEAYSDSIQLEEKEQRLVYIPCSSLFPHKDNPRKDLGDISELASSIKEKGVMQNLTVIPGTKDDTYTVIIGHRRLAAAKAADLETVPCVIVEMSYEDQIATMLLENIQRNDLTPYEQAQGFQLMLDLGETIETISDKTGLSKSTVSRRVKLADLDQNTLMKVSARQISIGDLDRLSKIEDEQERNKVLCHIGTNNFENEFKKALDAQKKQKIIAKAKEAFADIDITEVQHQDRATQSYERCFYYETGIEKGIEYVKELIDSGKKCFIEYGRYDYFYIYTEKAQICSSSPATIDNDSENEQETDAQAQARQEREKQEKLRQLMEIRQSALREAFDRAYQLRFDYIKNFTEAKAKEYAHAIIEENVKCNVEFYPELDNVLLNELLELGISDDVEEIDYSLYKDTVNKQPFKSLLAITWSFSDSKMAKCFNPDLTFFENELLDNVYNFLATLGYDPSDEEIELLNGKSPLYLTENE